MATRRRRTTLIGSFLAAVVALSACLAVFSCAPEEKHRVLSFFFDGVPPLHLREGALEPGAKAKTPGVATVARPTRPRVVWYVHEPARDTQKCGACHDRSAAFRLVKPLGQLCITCHEKTTLEHPRMHGPVAMGDCAACHEAHRSEYEHLVRAPVPELCFRCHERTPEGGTTRGCIRTSDASRCTACHGAHGGKSAYFLVTRRDAVDSPASAPPPAEREGRQ